MTYGSNQLTGETGTLAPNLIFKVSIEFNATYSNEDARA